MKHHQGVLFPQWQPAYKQFAQSSITAAGETEHRHVLSDLFVVSMTANGLPSCADPFLCEYVR